MKIELEGLTERQLLDVIRDAFGKLPNFAVLELLADVLDDDDLEIIQDLRS